MKSKVVFSVIAGALLLGVTSSQATLLSYEGFNYTAGTGIGGQSGGDSFGWGGAWSASGAFAIGTNQSTSLAYTDQAGNVLQTDGGSLLVGVPNIISGTGASGTPERQIGNFATDPSQPGWTNQLASGTYWVSYLTQWVGPGFGEANSSGLAAQGSLGLYSGVTGAANGGTERFDVGGVSGPVVSNAFTAWVANGKTGNPHNAPASPISTNLPYGLGLSTFVLMELVTGPTNVVNASLTPTDSLYIWFNWTNLTMMPTLDSANIVSTNEAFLSDVNGLRLAANAANGTRTNSMELFDEIRLGTTFGDVTPIATIPEPSSIALAVLGGLGGFGLITRRRKKS